MPRWALRPWIPWCSVQSKDSNCPSQGPGAHLWGVKNPKDNAHPGSQLLPGQRQSAEGLMNKLQLETKLGPGSCLLTPVFSVFSEPTWNKGFYLSREGAVLLSFSSLVSLCFSLSFGNVPYKTEELIFLCPLNYRKNKSKQKTKRNKTTKTKTLLLIR